MKLTAPPALRNIILFISIMTMLAFGFYVANKIAQQSTHKSTITSPRGLIALQSTLAGESFFIPPREGFHLLDKEQATLLMLASESPSISTDIDLCTQTTGSLENPHSIYPILIGSTAGQLASDAWLSQMKLPSILRQPIVLPEEDARDFPLLTIEGSLGNTKQPYGLMLRPLPSTQSGQWVLFSEAYSIRSTQIPVALPTPSWLLWRQHKEIGTNQESYYRAMEIRHIPDARLCRHSGSRPGIMRITLLRARNTTHLSNDQLVKVVARRTPPTAPLVHTQLPPGLHFVPESQTHQEDRLLFEAARDHGLIRHGSDGRIEVIPRDILRQQQLGVDKNWSDVDSSQPETQRLIDRLYRKADGKFVRNKVEEYNHMQSWAALRLKTSHPEQATTVSSSSWNASVDDIPSHTAEGMPEVTQRLFNSPPKGWSKWIRIDRWPANNLPNHEKKVVFELTDSALLPLRGQQVEVMTFEPPTAIRGATLLHTRPACFGPACPSPDFLIITTLQVHDFPSRLALTIPTNKTFNLLQPLAAMSHPIKVREGKLTWSPAPPSESIKDSLPHTATIIAHGGEPLMVNGQPTQISTDLGLLPVVGINREHHESISGQLRLHRNTSARLTIETRLQLTATQILECIGQQEGKWEQETGICQTTSQKNGIPEERRAGIIIMDADNGSILAAASTPSIKYEDAEEALSFWRFNPSHSPLNFEPWQHDGGLGHGAGSTFKLVSALALELQAQSDPLIDRILGGMTASELNQLNPEEFSTQHHCYPLTHCSRADGAVINNFNNKSLANYLKNGQIGLEEAISNSVNTWFGWLAQRSDQSLKWASTSPQAPPLAIDTALDSARPVNAIAHRLGFERPIRLDAGLLAPTSSPLKKNILRSDISSLGTIRSPFDAAKQGIGSNTIVTPLQAARLAAAIATGNIISPRLLEEVDGQAQQESSPPEALNIRLDRIRNGMHAVVQTGTARTIFQANATRRQISTGVFGKTGTASNPHSNRKTAWFTGWIEPNTIPGENRKLAFAVRIRETQRNGGDHAAEVIATLLESLMNLSRPSTQP